MAWTQNLKDEKVPPRKILLPEGQRTMHVVGVEYGTSKQNNPQFIFSIKDDETGYVDKFYCVDVTGKRGALKMILDACEASKDNEGNYSWDENSVIGKGIVCEVIHEPNTYINREGETINTKQHRIVEITALAWN